MGDAAVAGGAPKRSRTASTTRHSRFQNGNAYFVITSASASRIRRLTRCRCVSSTLPPGHGSPALRIKASRESRSARVLVLGDRFEAAARSRGLHPAHLGDPLHQVADGVGVLLLVQEERGFLVVQVELEGRGELEVAVVRV